MQAPEAESPRSTPYLILVGSLLALVVPILGALAFPNALGEHAALLWLLGVVPVFPFAYFYGIRGAALALAIGVVALLGTQLAATSMGLATPETLLPMGLAYVGIGAAVGWIVEVLHRDRDEVEDLAFTDLLTGLPNRRHARVFLDNEFAAAERGRFLAVVLFDLDSFKQYNDTYGHQAGDEALQLFASVLARTTRKMNLSARFGGEEFVSVLAGSDLEGAFLFADRVRTALRARNLGSPPLTVSAGVAEYRPTMGSPEELLAAADQALYAAKRDGRNCVRVYGHADFVVRGRDRPIADHLQAEVARADVAATLYELDPDDGEGTPDTLFGEGKRVLIVEDDVQVRRLIAASLTRDGFLVTEADDVPSGQAHLQDEFDVVIADILLPGTSGDRLVAAVKARWPGTQVVVITGLQDARVATDALNAGADRYLFKPFGMSELRGHLYESLMRREQLLAQRPPANEELDGKLSSRGESLRGARALVRAVEQRDPFTQGHAALVADYAEVLADTLDPQKRYLDRESLRLGCELHDVGKISVSESVLNKQARLSPDELREVRQHTVTGRRILEPFLADDLVLAATRWHHEWWDGHGYPDGLAGENIPLVARLIAVAEALAALTRARAYRGALPWDEALGEVRARAGTQFDPTMVALLDRCEEKLLTVYRGAQPQEGAAAGTDPLGG
jgi:diguanylate cyclase (GGDEF)-like protein